MIRADAVADMAEPLSNDVISALVVVFVFVTLFIGAFVAWIPLGILWLWGLYRVIKGWLRLADKRAVG